MATHAKTSNPAMTKEEAYLLLERVCSTHGCWHYAASGYINCIHCLYGSCDIVPKEARAKYREARVAVKGAQP